MRGRLPARRELAVYVVLGALWITGAVWLLLRYFMRPTGEFGEMPHPLEPWTMRLHGLAAFAVLWLLGQLWIVHIVPSWRSHRRSTGILLSAIMGALIVTGYLLYYAGDGARARVDLGRALGDRSCSGRPAAVPFVAASQPRLAQLRQRRTRDPTH